jgi:RNA polymerase sigma-70 factor (ECF subfamily)
MDDQRIIDLLWQRAEQGIDALQAKFGKALLGLSIHILKDPQDAEEAVSDTYLALWNTIPPARPDPLSTFAFKICRNTALNRLRSQTAQKRSAYELSLEELSEVLPGEQFQDQLDARALGQCIDRFLDTLNRQNRRIFLRRYWFGDSIDALAKEESLTPNALSVRLLRLRRQLKDYLSKEGFLL